MLPLPRRSALNQRLSVQRLSLYTLDDARSASVERVRLGAKKTREKEEGQAVDFIPIVPFSLNESERNAMALEPLVFECDEALAGVSSGIIMIDASWTALQLCGEEEEECFSFFFSFDDDSTVTRRCRRCRCLENLTTTFHTNHHPPPPNTPAPPTGELQQFFDEHATSAVPPKVRAVDVVRLEAGAAGARPTRLGSKVAFGALRSALGGPGSVRVAVALEPGGGGGEQRRSAGALLPAPPASGPRAPGPAPAPAPPPGPAPAAPPPVAPPPPPPPRPQIGRAHV